MNITDFSGFSISSGSSKVTTSFSGVAITRGSSKVTTAFSGVAITRDYVLSVCTIDADTLLPVIADLSISNSSFPLDLLTNHDTEFPDSEHHYTVPENSDLSFTASALNYVTKSVTYTYSSGKKKLVIELVKIETVPLSCTTIFKNRFGSTVTRPLTDGYVEVTFQSSAGLNENDNAVYFEAYPVNGSKYSLILLNHELISSGPDYLTYKVGVVKETDDYCYLSNIIKKQCYILTFPLWTL